MGALGFEPRQTGIAYGEMGSVTRRSPRFTGQRSSQSSSPGRPRGSADPFQIILVTGARCATWLHHAPVFLEWIARSGNGKAWVEGPFSTTCASWPPSSFASFASCAISSACCPFSSMHASFVSSIFLLIFYGKERTRGDLNPRLPA